jgi:hypothetical protein
MICHITIEMRYAIARGDALENDGVFSLRRSLEGMCNKEGDA